MDKHIEIWNIARKLKLSREFYEDLDTLLTEIESRNQQLILQNDNDFDYVCSICRDTGEYTIGGSFGGGAQIYKCNCGAKSNNMDVDNFK
jgi:hypothetical protein